MVPWEKGRTWSRESAILAVRTALVLLRSKTWPFQLWLSFLSPLPRLPGSVPPDQPPEAPETQEPGAERDVQREALLRVPSTAQLPADPTPHHPADQTRLQHPAQ